MIRMVEAGPRTNPEINEAIGSWISMEIFERPNALRDYSTIGVFNDGQIIFGCAYHNWHRDAGVLEMSGAASSKRFLTRPVLKRLYDFPLVQLGCQMVVMRVSEHNHTLLKQLDRLGYEAVRVKRLRGRHEDEMICTLTAEAWNEWKARHG